MHIFYGYHSCPNLSMESYFYTNINWKTSPECTKGIPKDSTTSYTAKWSPSCAIIIIAFYKTKWRGNQYTCSGFGGFTGTIKCWRIPKSLIELRTRGVTFAKNSRQGCIGNVQTDCLIYAMKMQTIHAPPNDPESVNHYRKHHSIAWLPKPYPETNELT